MSRRSEEMQRVFRYYQDQHGDDPVSPHEVVAWAVERNLLRLPRPADPREMLAEEMSKALREETRLDEGTGLPYRAKHAVTIRNSTGQITLWGDIDTVSRGFMQKAAQQRREQIVGDCLQLSLDLDHFNAMHRDERPITVVFDFTDDVAERKVVSGDSVGTTTQN